MHFSKQISFILVQLYCFIPYFNQLTHYQARVVCLYNDYFFIFFIAIVCISAFPLFVKMRRDRSHTTSGEIEISTFLNLRNFFRIENPIALNALKIFCYKGINEKKSTDVLCELTPYLHTMKKLY